MTDDIPEIEDDVTDDEDFFSAEMDDSMNFHTPGDELTILSDDSLYNTCEYNIIQNASGAVSENDIGLTSSGDISAGYNAIADLQESDSLCEPFLYSRDTNTIHSTNQRNGQNNNNNNQVKNANNKNEASPMDLDDDSDKTDESKTEGKAKKKSRVTTIPPWCTTQMLEERLLSILQDMLTWLQKVYRMMKKERK